MPIRTASVSRKIAANGQALHREAMRRMESGGADAPPSDSESALLEERRALKEERDRRAAQAQEPRPSALDRLVRTHRSEAKEKAPAEARDPKETKKPKSRRTRAEKHEEKAAAQEAARRSPKSTGKPAK